MEKREQKLLSIKINEIHRLEILRKTALLDSPIDEVFDRLTRLASMFLQVPVSLVSLVDNHRQFFISQYGLSKPWCDLRQTPLTHSFCKHVVTLNEPLIIEDARLVPLVAKNLAIPDLGVIAYLGIPLKLSSGVNLGSFCAIDIKPKKWTKAEIEILSTLASCVVTEIDLRLLNFNLDEILHTVTHDLKNPIGAINLSVDYLRKEIEKNNLSQDSLKQGLSRISMMSEKMNILVRSILERSKMSSFHESLKKTQCDLLNLLNEVRDIFFISAKAKQIEIEVWSRAGSQIFCDRDQLIQALSNLVSNAICYSPHKSRITLSGKIENGRVIFDVIDNGAGIDPIDLPKTFEKYWQGHKSDSEGHGLGLHIVREIILAHGGEISIKSDLGVGTTVSFSIPQL